MPEWAASLAAQYRMDPNGPLAGLRFGGALFFRGDRFADIDNDTALDAYTRVDVNAAWQRGSWVASLNVRNLFDERFIQTDTIPGMPRTVEARLGLRF